MSLEAIRVMKESSESINIRLTLPLVGVSTRVDAAHDDRRMTMIAATYELYIQSVTDALVKPVLGLDPSLEDLTEWANLHSAAEARCV